MLPSWYDPRVRHLHTGKTRREHIDDVIADVAFRWNVPVDEIKGRARYRRVSFARMEVYHVLRTQFRMSLPHIGRIMGRDHSTVLLGVRRYESLTPEQKAAA